jgi:ferredoxin-thioredoxin reductase catalytic subunit
MTTSDEQAAIEREKAVIERRVRRYAEESGFRLNTDAKKLDLLLAAMARRKVRNGEFYCPCRVVTGDREKDRPSICPCDEHRKQIAETGHCRCGLFFKPGEETKPPAGAAGEHASHDEDKG